jgi:hypothetical protein
MEYFFKRLEAYIKVLPTAAMREIIVKIMAEVISILGVVTKEIQQGRTSMRFSFDMSPKVDLPAEKYLKRLLGMKEVEDALQRLDKLTQEEARMAAAEALTITRGIDDKVNDVGEILEGVDERVQRVDVKVEGIDDKVLIVDSKVQGVDDKVLSVDGKVQNVDISKITTPSPSPSRPFSFCVPSGSPSSPSENLLYTCRGFCTFLSFLTQVPSGTPRLLRPTQEASLRHLCTRDEDPCWFQRATG